MRKKKESRKKRKRDAQEKKAQADANHLTVMSAINGSTASSVSLKSVGNGSIGMTKREDLRLVDALITSNKNGPRDEAKTVDSPSSKNDSPKKEVKPIGGRPVNAQSQDSKLKTGIRGKQSLDASLQSTGMSQSGGGVAGGKDSLGVITDNPQEVTSLPIIPLHSSPDQIYLNAISKWMPQFTAARLA